MGESLGDEKTEETAMNIRYRRNFSTNHLLFRSIFLAGMAWGMGSGSALAASEIIQGPFTEADPAGQSYRDQGVCRLITGPREDLPAGQFMLTVGDQHAADASEVQLTGTYSTHNRAVTLHPDKAAATQYFQNVLSAQLGEAALFQLKDLDAQVSFAPPDRRLICDVSLRGWLTLADATQRPVSLSFKGEGIYDPGDTAPSVKGRSAAASVAAGANPSCPTDSLAPLGVAPLDGRQCTPGTQCLVDFPSKPNEKSYRWWTSFQYYGPQGNPTFPFGGFFYNGGLRTAFAPKHAFVAGDGLHLKIANTNLGGPDVVAGGEAVLLFNSDGTEANLGYGDYLVTATVLNSTWATLDPNAAFGAFTYERLGNGSAGNTTNPHRELDLAEISRWGWNQMPPPDCPNTGVSAPLCTGNAQFALQPWDAAAPPPQDQHWANLNRYTINPDVKTITLVMRWHGANQPVAFEQYNGAFTFEGGLPTPDNVFTSVAAQNVFVPATNCERFHLNLWMGFFNNPAARGCSNERGDCPPNPAPRILPQEIVVTNFEFQKFTPPPPQ